MKALIYIPGVVLLFGISSCSGDAEKVTVEAASFRTIIEIVSANGKVQPEVEVKISADVSGEIVNLPVKEGDQVKKGDLLAVINPDLYEAAVARVEASANTSRANLANSKARLAQVEAQLINTEANYKRNKTLWEQKAISEADYDAARANFEVARSEVEAARQSVKASEFSVKSALASLKEASDNLDRTSIYAPNDGTVSMLGVEQGERVVGTSQMAGTEIMRIADLYDMEVNVDVNESDIVRVSLGDTAEIEIDAYLDRKFLGIVTEIANSASSQTVSSEQVTTFNVKIRILRSSYEDLTVGKEKHLSPFRPGMSATVEIRTDRVEDVLAVPIQAVTVREDTTSKDNSDEIDECVFLYEQGIATKQVVKTGIQDNRHIQITEGLSEGQEVISGPYTVVSKRLDDGDEVKKVDKDKLYRYKRSQ